MCRTLIEYRDDVEELLKVLKENSNNNMTTKFPCNKCGIMNVETFDIVREHLICDGIIEQYSICYLYGDIFPIQVSCLFFEIILYQTYIYYSKYIIFFGE